MYIVFPEMTMAFTLPFVQLTVEANFDFQNERLPMAKAVGVGNQVMETTKEYTRVFFTMCPMQRTIHIYYRYFKMKINSPYLVGITWFIAELMEQ